MYRRVDGDFVSTGLQTERPLLHSSLWKLVHRNLACTTDCTSDYLGVRRGSLGQDREDARNNGSSFNEPFGLKDIFRLSGLADVFDQGADEEKGFVAIRWLCGVFSVSSEIRILCG